MKALRTGLGIALMLVLALCLLAGCGAKNYHAAAPSGRSIEKAADLAVKGTRIGVSGGSVQDLLVQELYPEADPYYFKTMLDGCMALSQGKLDAFLFDKKQMELMLQNGMKGVRLLDETLGGPTQIAFGLSGKSKIPDLQNQVNRFIRESRQSGLLDDVYSRWVTTGKREMPEIPAAASPKYHLTVGTTGSVEPYSYYAGNRLVGYDIELMYRLAAWLDADVEFQLYNWEGIIPAAQAGKVDIIASNLQVKPERMDSFLYSDTLYEEQNGIAVRDTDAAGAATGSGGVYKSVAELDGKRIGVQMGTNLDDIVLNQLPKAQLSYYNTYPDMLAALETDKIDGFPGAKPLMEMMAAESPGMKLLPEAMETFDVAIVLPKTPEGQRLAGQFNEWLASQKASGAWEELINKWVAGPEEQKTVPDYAAFPAPNGVLNMATEGSYAPMEYYRDGQIVGMDVDLAARFCEACGYGLTITDMNFESVLPAVQTGKADFAAAGIAVTEERKESVLFSDVYYTNSTVMAVMDSEAASSVSFLESIQSSFEKTFIRESRWKLFMEGIGTTLMITVLAIVFGTALGFAVYMACRNGNRAANALTRFFVWLVQGMPAVVLLMILFYVIFSNSAVSGAVVSILGFTLVFGSGVYGMLRSGVGAVPKGQTEAAYALGYGNTQTFFRIILPQAIPHFLPSYKGEIVSLVKATAIVGYIAVQDLTKMGDIVRGRTYEAFFPLIAVAVIYFILGGILTFVVNRLEINVNPRRRKKEDVLKDVVVRD